MTRTSIRLYVRRRFPFSSWPCAMEIACSCVLQCLAHQPRIVLYRNRPRKRTNTGMRLLHALINLLGEYTFIGTRRLMVGETRMTSTFSTFNRSCIEITSMCWRRTDGTLGNPLPTSGNVDAETTSCNSELYTAPQLWHHCEFGECRGVEYKKQLDLGCPVFAVTCTFRI